MRIFFITSKLNFVTAGGSVMDLHLKAKGLLERGHEVTVVTAFSRFNNIPEKLPYLVKEENILSAGLLGIQRGVYRILRKYQHDADVFHVDGQIFVYGSGAYRMFGGRVPVVGFFNSKLNCWSDMQGNDEQKRTLFRKIKKRLRLFVEHRFGVPFANRLDAFVFNTPMVEQLYVDFGFNKAKSAVIEDYVDTGAILQRERRAENHAKASGGVVTLFTTGRMIKEKGFELVIRAFASLKDKNRFRVVMCGGGPDSERLQQLVRDLKLSEYFTFPGWVKKEELWGYFRQADVFVFPKWWIEYGSALLTEAYGFGLPCIVPRGGALEWLSKNAAVTFAPENAEELAGAIERVGSDAELRKTLSRGAVGRAEALRYENLAERLDAVIRRVAPRSP